MEEYTTMNNYGRQYLYTATNQYFLQWNIITSKMNPSLDPLLHFHPFLAGRLDGGIRSSVDGQFASNRHVESADWVIAFCYGRSWCRLVSKREYLVFLSSAMAKPVKEEYTHSIPVPQVLDPFCEELLLYQTKNGEHAYVLTLLVAHFSLQLHQHSCNPYALDIQAKIRRVLIRLSVFYFLMYSCPYMIEWGKLKHILIHYVFIWERSAHYNMTGETLHLALSQESRLDDRNTWIQCIEPRHGVVADDSEIEFRYVKANNPSVIIVNIKT
jgi:hypothetical protein